MVPDMSTLHHQLKRHPLLLRESDPPVTPSTLPLTIDPTVGKHLPLLDDPKACRSSCRGRWYHSRRREPKRL